MDHPMSSPKQSSTAFKNRREFFELTAAVGLTVAAGLTLAGCDQAKKDETAEKKPDVSKTPETDPPAGPVVEGLMANLILPDVMQVKPDAKPAVTIVEYASMTCSHCAAFHATTYPVLISKYVDTGKARFVLREFPLDPLATAAFMLARCAGPDKRNAMVDLLFQQQKNWAFTENPIEALSGLVKQTGMSQESFDACLKDQDLHEKINEIRDHAAEKFGVNATPTFFINGVRHSGEITPEELDKLLEPLLKG
jgi:protein-disulfide isomerase